MQVSSKVKPAYDGQTLLDYLADRFTYLSREQWLAYVEEGRIRYQGAVVEGEVIVATGGVVLCELPDFTPPDVNLNYQIVYEDEWLLGVNKPPNLRVHSGGKFATANLMYQLRYKHDPPYLEAMLVNRLDAGTSGILILTRDRDSLRIVNKALAKREVMKTYWALVWGEVEPVEGVWRGELGKVVGGLAEVPRHGLAEQLEVEKGKAAVTRYKRLGYKDGISWLALYPETGRTHQLRVQTAGAGYPLVGDALYQMTDEAYLSWVRDKGPWEGGAGLLRPALHSYQVEFKHPATREMVMWQADLAGVAGDLAAVMGRLGFL